MVVLAVLPGCLKSTAYHCETDDNCTAGGMSGRCEATGFCSFSDATCSSGSRYGNSAGSLAGQCVGGDMIDAGTDSDSEGDNCYGAGLEKVCLVNPPSTLDLSAAINTDTEPMCLAAYPTICAIGAGDITVSGTVTVTGSRPLVLVAVNTLSVNGTLDASSTIAGVAGAASNNAACVAATGTNGNTGAGGGAGGSFGGRGGNGGTGSSQDQDNAGGTAPVVMTPTMLVGGCGGSAGGNSVNTGGAGGRSGGALYLIAGGHITVSGGVFASGAGGAGAPSVAGGGGGGTGGMIGLDAPAVTVTGKVIANGGAGAGGGGNNNLSGPGRDGTQTAARATGGTGGAGGGGRGGDGTAAATLDGATGADGNLGGGGGGGGAGIIRVFPTQSLGGTVSPAPS